MNEDYPLLHLPSPQIAERRRERPRAVPPPPELLARRQEIARTLTDQIAPLSDSLREVPEDERDTVFYKLEHEGPVPLGGTELKPVTEPSEKFSLVIPRSDNLDRLAEKIRTFATGTIRAGHAPNERLGTALKVIKRGDPKDRLSQALFEKYDQLIQEDRVICEIEMTSLARGRRQQRTELEEIRNALDTAFANGVYGNFFEHEEIKGTCRAVIRCTGRLFQQLVEDSKWQRKISWFDARPEFETFHSILLHFSVDNLGSLNGPDETGPVVCIVDSGVTSGNPFLTPVTREELLRSFLRRSPDAPYDEHGHGSGVASLASYYALNIQGGASNSGKVWVASARVLDDTNSAEEDRLFSKVLTEVVELFVPLEVRIFNLSVNITNRKWNEEAKRTVPRRSWIARTIDRLTREKDIVFVLSTGNVTTSQVRHYVQDVQNYPSYFIDPDCAIMDPGQAALALTIGALAPSTLAVGAVGTAAAIALQNQPAPFTRCGPGINGEVKPELVDFGGNYLLDSSGPVVRTNPGTDVMMASHRLTPALAHDSGTSFAAPRVAHKLALILADLQSLGIGVISSPLLKAFIVNSASCARIGDGFEGFRDDMEVVQPKHWLNVAGYGMADHNFATYSDPYSAVLFFQGQLSPDTVAFFDIPVPAALATADSGTKRLTVTVVHAPEVQRWGLERYLGTTFKWRLFRGDVSREDVIASMSIEEGEEEESTQPDRPEELKGKLGITLRSRGTVQHDVIEWSRHHEAYSEANYTLAVAAYEKWGRPSPPEVPYAVVLRLEDTTQTTQVYSEVRTILAQIEVQARTGV